MAPAFDLEDPVPARLERLVALFGSNRLAELLGVARSQPSRWRSGKESPGPERRRRILELDFAMNRLLEVFHPETAALWLESHNPQAGGRPVDVLRLRGPLALLPLIAYEEQEAIG